MKRNRVILVPECTASKEQTSNGFFCNKRIQSTPLDPRPCLGLFLENFTTAQKMMQNGCISVLECTISGKRTSNRFFHNKRFQSIPLDPKTCLAIFGAFRYCMKNDAEWVHFRTRMHLSNLFH